jgi:murein DD-endopeptidase MepM/ murein hydrolase activator NlpD
LFARSTSWWTYQADKSVRWKGVKKSKIRIMDVAKRLAKARDKGLFGKIVEFAGHPVILRDFTNGANVPRLPEGSFDVGKYNERRESMYETELFKDESNSVGGYDGRRNIHIGLDIGGSPDTPLLAFGDGEILHFGYNEPQGDYGHVIVTSHTIEDPTDGTLFPIFALYGHLSTKSIVGLHKGQTFQKGDVIAYIGDEHENGGWPPHVHFQLSVEEPITHDMPGVVADKDHGQALQIFPDPRLVLGDLYEGHGAGRLGLWERARPKL